VARALTLVTVTAALAGTDHARAQQTAPPAGTGASNADFDVQKLFANTCGWCHSNAGRTAGRGPQLMGTTLTDAEIIHRIRTGKPGAMPAFADAFTDEQLRAIVRYIRDLKDDGAK